MITAHKTSIRQLRVILVAAENIASGKAARFKGKAEIVLMRARAGRVDLKSLFRFLAGRGVVRLLVEGGGEVIENVLSKGLAQEIYMIVAPKVIGGRLAPSSVGGKGVDRLEDAIPVRSLEAGKIGADVLLHGLL